jgi:hypothetical protein
MLCSWLAALSATTGSASNARHLQAARKTLFVLQ